MPLKKRVKIVVAEPMIQMRLLKITPKKDILILGFIVFIISLMGGVVIIYWR